MDLTFSCDGLTYTITPPPGDPARAPMETTTGTGADGKAARAGKWTPERSRKHPRDPEGQWIEVGSEVQVLGVGKGRTTADVAKKPNHVTVRLTNGNVREVPNGSIRVTARPDGSKPIPPPPDQDAPASPSKRPVKPGARQQGPAAAAPPQDPAGAPPTEIRTPADIREYWSSGATTNPDLSEEHRSWLRGAGRNAHDIQLSADGRYALVQPQEGDPWQITNHHGQSAGPPQADLATALTLAEAYERELVDADGAPLDLNAPGARERVKRFRTADGENVREASERILREVQNGASATPPDQPVPPPAPGKPKRAQSVSGVTPATMDELRAVASVDYWKRRTSLVQGRMTIRQSATDLASAVESGNDHEVIAAYDRYAAAVFDASHIPSGSLNRSGGGSADLVGDLRRRGQAVFLAWRAAAPNAGRATGRRFTTVDQVTAHLAEGGDTPLPLSDPRRTKRRQATAAQISDGEAVLTGRGAFVAIRQPDGGWVLHSSAMGDRLTGTDPFASRAEAVEAGDRIRSEVPHDWDHPENFVADVYPIDGVLAVMADLRDNRKPDPTPPPDPEPPQPEGEPGGVTGETDTPTLRTPQDVRDYWASGGAPDQKIPPPETLRSLSTEVHDLRLSSGGSLVLVQDRKGGTWRITNHHGGPLPSEVDQTSLTRATAMAARIEALRDEDGGSFDWNAPDVGGRSRAWRDSRGLDLRMALGEAIQEQREANKPVPKPPVEVTPELTPPDQPITSLDQVRRHLAAGGDDSSQEVRDAAQRIANDPGLVLVADGTFVLQPWKPRGATRRQWLIHHVRTARGATPPSSRFTREEAEAFAERLKTLWGEDDAPFDWDAPDVVPRMGRIHNLDDQMRAIAAGRIPPKPGPPPARPGAGLDTPEKVREFWESGGKSVPDLNYAQRAVMRTAADRYGDLRLSDGGTLVLARTGKSGPWRVLNQYGQLAHLDEMSTLTRARDMAGRMEALADADGNRLDWNQVNDRERDAVRTGQGETWQEALDRLTREQRAELDAVSGEGVSKVGNAADVRRYWAQGGSDVPQPGMTPGQVESHRQSLRMLADVNDLQLSPGGVFVLTRHRVGTQWSVSTVEGLSIAGGNTGSRPGFTNAKKAREFARRLETEVVDADGTPLDWNALDVAERLKGFRTRSGESVGQAVGRILRGEPEPVTELPAPDPAPDPTGDPAPDPTGDPAPDPTPDPTGDPAPDPTPDPTGDGPPFATVDAFRAYLRAMPAHLVTVPRGRSETDEEHAEAVAEQRAYIESIAADPNVRLSPGGKLIAVKGRERGSGWAVLTTSGLKAANMYTAQKNRKEAEALAAALEAMRSADGQPMPFEAVDFGAAIKGWRDADGRSAQNALIAVVAEHEISLGREDSYIVQSHRSNEESRAARNDWQERARAGGYIAARGADVVAGDVVEFDVDPSKDQQDFSVFGGAQRPAAGQIITIRGTIRGTPGGNWHNGRRSADIYSMGEGATWSTPDGRSGPLAGNRMLTRSHIDDAILFRRDAESQAFEDYLAAIEVTPEGLARPATRYGFPVDSAMALAAGMGRDGSFELSELRKKIREYQGMDAAELDREALRAVAELETERVKLESSDRGYLGAVRLVPLAAIESERRRRSLPDPDPEMLAGARVARRLHAAGPEADGVDIAALPFSQAEWAREYALAVGRFWDQHFVDAVPDKTERARSWYRVANAIDDVTAERRALAEVERGELRPPRAMTRNVRDAALRRLDPDAADRARDLLEALDARQGQADEQGISVDRVDADDVEAAWGRADDALKALMRRSEDDAGLLSDDQYDWVQRVNDYLAAEVRQSGALARDREEREFAAQVRDWDTEQLRERLTRARYDTPESRDLIAELERRGYNEDGHRPYGSPHDLPDPSVPTTALVGQRVALHDGGGGWIVGYLHQPSPNDWIVSSSPDDPKPGALRLTPRGNRQLPSLTVVTPGHPALAGLPAEDYSREELEAEMQRLASQVAGLWKAGRRRGDPAFDAAFDRHGQLGRELESRPEPEPVQPTQDESLFDDEGNITGDAAPAPRQVRADALAVGDRIHDETAGPLEVLDVTRIRDMVWVTLRDGDDARVVRGLASDAQVGRVGTAGRTPPPPVTVIDRIAQDLTAGERILLADSNGNYRPATVEANVPEPDGDGRHLDVRYDDGQAAVVMVDRGEVLPLLGGPESGPEPTPEPTPEPMPEPTPEPAPGPDQPQEPAQPAPLPEGTTVARPVLYTYQRRNLVALGLDHSPDETVRQAAARVRERMPLSADQAAALAAAVRAQSTQGTPARQRSATRLAAALDAASAQARGLPRPRRQPGRDTPFKARATNVVEGDTVALPGPRGRAVVVTVTGRRALMGGRLVELDVTHPDGRAERLLLNRDSDAWVMPDLPEPEPVQPTRQVREHITTADVRPGDVIVDSAGHEAEILSIQHVEGRAALKAAIRRPGIENLGEEFWLQPAEDGGPTIVRIRRGAESAAQPYRATLEDDPGAGEIPYGEVRHGDRVAFSWRGGTPGPEDTGTVTNIVDVIVVDAETGARRRTGRRITFRSLTGPTFDKVMQDGGPMTVARLKEADGEVSQAIARAAAERAALEAAAPIQDLLREHLKKAYGGVFWDALRNGDSSAQALQRIRELGLRAQPIEKLSDLLGSRSPSERAAMERRVSEVLSEVSAHAKSRALAAVEHVDTGDSYDDHQERRRILNDYLSQLPADDERMLGEVSLSLGRMATQLHQTVTPAGGGAAPSQTPEVPAVEGVADLTARVGAYRAALGDGATFGRAVHRRPSFAPTTLSDLEAGKVPEIQWVEMAGRDVDRAADGGPGELAMHHLDVVMAAGRDLNNALQERIRAAGFEMEEFNDLRENGITTVGRYNDMLNRRAEAEGYESFRDMLLKLKASSRGDGYSVELPDRIKRETTAVWRNDLLRMDELVKQFADLRRQKALEVLAEVRADGVGGGPKVAWSTPAGKPLGERSEMVKAMRYAQNSYPTAWVEAYERYGRGRWNVSKVKRGFYRDRERKVALSPGRAHLSDGTEFTAVAIHEMGHGMEQAVPGLLDLQEAYLWRRTASGEIGSRTRERKKSLGGSMSGESAYFDKFRDPYTGKDYPYGGKVGAFEVLTTAMESLMGGSSEYLDDDLQEWTLGALALLGTRREGA